MKKKLQNSQNIDNLTPSSINDRTKQMSEDMEDKQHYQTTYLSDICKTVSNISKILSFQEHQHIYHHQSYSKS